MDSISRTRAASKARPSEVSPRTKQPRIAAWPRRCRRDAANLPDSRRRTDGRANTAMRGDGNGWVVCAAGHRHWGRFGAAGLLLRHTDPADRCWVLLQHRAPWSHHGDTWGLPGGARDSHESSVEAALREAAEEVTLDLSRIRVLRVRPDDHGGWSYDTVVAGTAIRLDVAPANSESLALRWVPEPEVAALRLHPGLAATWPQLMSCLLYTSDAADDLLCVDLG